MNILLAILVIAILILLIIGSIIFIKLIKKNQLEPKIIELITEAEIKYNSGEGVKKFEYVFDKLYNTFAPKVIKILFSADEIKMIIQFVFDKVKIALDYKGE